MSLTPTIQSSEILARSSAVETLAAVTIPEWEREAKCHGRDELFFPTSGGGDKQKRAAARKLCRSCPVLRDCAIKALSDFDKYPVEGVWASVSMTSKDPGSRKRYRERLAALAADVDN